MTACSGNDRAPLGGQAKVKEYSVKVSRHVRDGDSLAKIIRPFTFSAFGLVSGASGGAFPANPDLFGNFRASLQQFGNKTGEKNQGSAGLA